MLCHISTALHTYIVFLYNLWRVIYIVCLPLKETHASSTCPHRFIFFLFSSFLSLDPSRSIDRQKWVWMSPRWWTDLFSPAEFNEARVRFTQVNSAATCWVASLYFFFFINVKSSMTGLGEGGREGVKERIERWPTRGPSRREQLATVRYPMLGQNQSKYSSASSPSINSCTHTDKEQIHSHTETNGR